MIGRSASALWPSCVPTPAEPDRVGDNAKVEARHVARAHRRKRFEETRQCVFIKLHGDVDITEATWMRRAT